MASELTVQRIAGMWDGHDDFTTLGFPYVAWVIEQDIADMRADDWDEAECIEELADVAINSMRAMMEFGYDPESTIRKRLVDHSQKGTDALEQQYVTRYCDRMGVEYPEWL